MKLRVHIERLVLDGLPWTGRDAAMMQAALQAELARLLAASPGRLADRGAVGELRAHPVTLGRVVSGDAAGRAIAASIHGGLVE